MRSFFAIFCLVLLSLPCLASQFRTRVTDDPLTLDWNLAHTSEDTPVVMNIMEGMFAFDRSLNVVPQLANAWEVSPDRRTYRFKLKKGVLWSDGRPLTANDFVHSWKRLLDPLTGATYSYLLFDIEGAEDFNSRKAGFEKVAIRALDESTLEVRLRRPIAYFPQLLTFWVTFPIRKDLIDQHGAQWAKVDKIVVLGPYLPVQHQHGVQIELKRNEKYHGPKPKIDSVLIRIINEDSTALTLFKQGQLDFVRPLNYLDLGSLRESKMIREQPYLRTCYLHFNTTKYPFNLAKARLAVSLAIDREAIPKILHRKVGPAFSFAPDNILSAPRAEGTRFDPEAGRRLLAEIGMDPASFPPIDLLAPATDENTLILQFLQSQLKKNLGLATQIETPDFRSFRAQLDLKTRSLYFRCWGADYPDPDSYLALMTASSGNNKTGWKNAAYDELVTRAAGLASGTERSKLYRSAQQILVQTESPIAPLYFDSIVYLLQDGVRGFLINSLNYVFYRDIELSRKDP